ncbi:MAG: hypothetical protein Unbinned2706contig1001_14 [Prokaryotic dsDNA virus sp.]|nr:MAG: hypothetical protein Unbinned2706contig1001_14 [Prokaryotic dsDNA virus sp.]|tara:strand:- start:7309 stop:7992 length:684 start_codon:yes stop_codon:yes gene_type:complete
MSEEKNIPALTDRVRDHAHGTDWSDFVQTLHALGMFEGMERPKLHTDFRDQLKGLWTMLDENPQQGISLACMSVVSSLACAQATMANQAQHIADLLGKMVADLEQYGDEPILPHDRKHFTDAVSQCIPFFKGCSAEHQRDHDTLAAASQTLGGGDLPEYAEHLAAYRARKDAELVTDLIAKSEKTGEPIDRDELPSTVRNNIDLESLTELIQQLRKLADGIDGGGES